MKKAVSLILALILCLPLCACGNKAEEEYISNQISGIMSEYKITDYDVSIKKNTIVATEFENLSENELLYIVKYLYFEDISIKRISDGTSIYYYQPYSISENAPTPGLWKMNNKSDKLILADGNPFR